MPTRRLTRRVKPEPETKTWLRGEGKGTRPCVPTMERRLGNYERYSLSRANIGIPPVLAFVAVLEAAPAHSAVVAAVGILLSRYPLLSCVVEDRRTRTPSFQTRSVKPEEVAGEEDASGRGGETIGDALLLGLEEAARLDLEAGPLWRVFVLGGLAGEEVGGGDGGGGEGARLLLSCSHVISDGAGTKALFGELLALILRPAQPHQGELDVPAVLPASMESSIDVRPSFGVLLPEVFNSLVTPLLPSFLRPLPPPPT